MPQRRRAPAPCPGLESLGVADVRRFLVRLDKETTAATAKESHRALRSAPSSACHEELITRNVEIGLGSHDLGVATTAADLNRAGHFPVVVFSGGNTPPLAPASRAARRATTTSTR